MTNVKKSAATKTASSKKANAVIDSNNLEEAKKAILSGIADNKEGGTKDSNIYTYHHLLDDRFLSPAERENEKIMKTYRRNLRAKLEKHLDYFSTISKNMQVSQTPLKDVVAIVKEEKAIDNFMEFYKKFYKINDFSAASIANTQRQEKVKAAISLIQMFFTEINK